ncbi:inactive leucine-rich repeat receptor-like serine/threonine-protein kinase At1g60630 [Elaeis guineensis]|uniref:Inactive leucine-rich repeat receptor-like serine/threonine-protein kinase At1g60630 n=1 Tax=Elaeis guineensis var. tenera TaxID=51953 RepID=A0A6I9S921_ELAGV|nr:inactive leucine-rich repeat receptor-like serine/threonine-protein kinase At1g60630 [Elaeis guineensis]
MESEPVSPRCLLLFLLLLCFFFARISSIRAKSSDAEALLALKASIDPLDAIPWRREASLELCNGWYGVKECASNGRVSKLVLEFLNLTGILTPEILAPLDQLRVLSLKSNSLFGAIPELTALVNLKSLYLNDNRFSGRIPATLAVLHRIKVVVLSDNLLSGPIPVALAGIPRLYTLFLQHNRLTGEIPPLDQPSLRYLNVSNNNLSGEIPATQALSQFNLSSFHHNPNLCGSQIKLPCSKTPTFPPSNSPKSSISSTINAFPPIIASNHKKCGIKRLIAIVAGSIAGVLVLSTCLALAVCLVLRRKRQIVAAGSRTQGVGVGKSLEEGCGGGGSGVEGGGGGGGTKGGFSWEGEGLGKLVFCGCLGEMYSLDELLKASAETLGRGTVGSTYKAVMESGFIVTVKRLKDSTQPGVEEFRRRMEELGRLRHPNLVPLRAYLQAKEERLLVYDYFPNGSLFSLIHGSRPSGSGKPLHWTSCLKIAEDVAAGLLYLHQSSPPVVHGNLKSSNVLLGTDFESCLTDYGLVPCLLPSADDDHHLPTSSSLFYRAPETRHPRSRFVTPHSDVYSFGVLLLELLTGKTPFQDLVEEHGADIPQWVRSVRDEEKESGEDPVSSGNEASEDKLAALLNVAMACVAVDAERRPATKEVLKMIRDTRTEVIVSSNSSDHSPGRWSDTVQSLPRERGPEHLNFGERD